MIEKRKIQHVGRSFTVSLPINYVRNLNLDKIKNARVIIRNNQDGSLTILPDKDPNINALEKEIKIHVYREVAREAVQKILSGAEKITIFSDKQISSEIINEIHIYIDGLPQAEIIEENSQRIVIYNLGFKNINNRKILHRLLSIISEIFVNIREQNNDKLERNIKELKKFYLILVAHIREFHDKSIHYNNEDLTHTIASDYRVFSYQIKMMGYILKDLELDDAIVDYFSQIEDYFNKIFEAFLKKDERFAHKLWFNSQNLMKKGKDLIDRIPKERTYKIKLLLLVVKLCRGMTALIYS